MIRRLGDDRGAAATEFALLAPLLFGVMFMIIEGCRMIWTQQVVQETAFASVRCMALGTAGCTSTAEVQNWAVARARQSGIVISTASVTVETAPPATSCSNQAGMRRVSIAAPYSKLVNSVIPAVPATLNAAVCFPPIT